MEKLAKVAAVTAAYERPDILQKWVDHNAALFGHDNLFVLSQGPRALHAPILENINSLHLPRVFDTDFDAAKANWFSHQCALLLTLYQCVVVTDMDELLCLAPDHPGTLPDYLLSSGVKNRAPLFFNLVPFADRTTVDWATPVLGQAKAMQFAAHLCNPMVLYHPVTFAGRHTLRDAYFDIDPALHTYHLKYLATDSAGDYYDTLGQEVRGKFSERGEDVTALKGWSRGRRRLDRWIAHQNTKPIHPYKDLTQRLDGLYGTDRKTTSDGFLVKPRNSEATPLFEIPESLRGRY